MGFWIQTIIRFKGSEEQLDNIRETLTGNKKAELTLRDAYGLDHDDLKNRLHIKLSGDAQSIIVPKTKDGFQDIVVYTRCAWPDQEFYDGFEALFPDVPYRILNDEADLMGDYDNPHVFTNDKDHSFFTESDLTGKCFNEINLGIDYTEAA